MKLAAVGAMLLGLVASTGVQAQQRSIINTGFEAPPHPLAGGFGLFPANQVVGWETTDPSNIIEIWANGFQDVPPYEGGYFAEMNANNPAALYQNVCFTTGESIGWTFAHRARPAGADPQIANFEIASSSGTVLQTLASQSTPIGGGWQVNSGRRIYTGPSGIQRIQFRTTNPGSVGNFLDAIQIDLVGYTEFSASATSSTEGAASPTLPAIRMTGKVDATTRIPLTITGGTATQGADYALSQPYVEIPVGNYNGTLFPLPLIITNDTAMEANETIIVRLGAPTTDEVFLANPNCSGAPILQATHTIVDDDTDLRIIKTLASASASPAEGDTVSFRIAVNNIGSRAAAGVSLTDLLPAGLTFVSATPSPGTYNSASGLWTVGALANGGTATLVLNATVNAGQGGQTLTNTTTAAGGTNVDATRTDGDDLAETITINATPGLEVVKTGALNRGADGVASVGDVITYAFTVRNTGNTVLNGVTVSDPLPGLTVTGGPITLLRGQSDSTTFRGTYVLTQADIDRGRIDNTALSSGTSPPNTTVQGRGTASTPIEQVRGMTVDKTQTGGPATVNAAGQILTYRIVVRNTGNTSLTGVIVNDTLPDASVRALTGATESISSDGVLQPNETWTYTTTYTVTQADVDGGASLVNSVLAASNQTPPTSDETTTPVARSPAVSIDKAVDRSTMSAPGVLNYTIVVRNTGNASLTGVVLTDTLPNGSPGTVSGPTGDGGVAGRLDVGEVWTYQASYAVTQTEINAGRALTNTASVKVNQIQAAISDTAVTTISRAPALTIDKTVDQASINGPGTLTYTIRVTNSGNIALNGVSVRDILPGSGGGGPLFSPAEAAQQPGGGGQPTAALTGPTGDGGTPGVLDVGETWTFTDTYVVTQELFEANASFTNTASATSNETFFGPSVSDTAVTTTVHQPSMSIEKEVDRAAADTAGTVLNYTVTLRNTGNVSLGGVTLSDTLAQNGAVVALTRTGGDADGDDRLDLTETWTYSGSYTVTAADLTAGQALVNTATANATELPAPVTADAETALVQEPSLTVEKDVDRDSIYEPGPLNYTVRVRNSGNVPLTAVTPSDSLNGTPLPLSGPSGDGGTVGTLDVGETWIYTATYIVTAEDLNAGTPLTNVATVTATRPGGGELDGDSVTTAVVQVRSLSVEKTVDQTTISAPGALNYTIRIHNTGSVALTGVSVSDTLPDGGPATLAGPTGDAGAVNTLDVGETWTFTTTYSVTQAEIDAGTARINNVSVTSTQTPTPQTAQATTTISGTASLQVSKKVDRGSIDRPGRLTYTITADNTGNRSLSGVTIDDVLSNGGAVTLSAPVESLPGGTSGVLDVGESWTWTAYYDVTQADIDAGVTLTNIATVDTAQTAPQNDAAETLVETLPDIEVKKDVDQSFVSETGVLTYTIYAANNGNQRFTSVALTDVLSNGGAVTLSAPVESLPGGQAGVLDIGETWTWTGTYSVTQADLNAGVDLTNTATVVADLAAGGSVTRDDNAITAMLQRGQLELVKTGTLDPGPDGRPNVGDAINYAFTVVNGGNVTLTNLTVADTLPGVTVTGGPLASLAPGASDSTTFTGRYILNQADVDAGRVDNMASVTGADPSGNPISDNDAFSLALAGEPELSLAKTGTLAVGTNGRANVGDVITYAFTVRNTGDLTLSNITLTDALPGVAVSGGPIVSLAPGVVDTTTFTATYALTQADIDAGRVINDASATGRDPSGGTATADADTTVNLPAAPAMTVTKSQTSGPTPVTAVGQVLGYQIVVANTGNISLTDVAIADTLPDGSAGTTTLSGGDADSDGVLDVGETWTYTASYTVTQADIDAGAALVNTVAVTTTQIPTPVQDDASTQVATAPAMTVTKTQTTGPNPVTAVGQVLGYQIVVANTGNISLTGVTLVDTLPDGSTGPTTLSGGDADSDGVLDVGETWTYTASYTVTQADVDAGAALLNRAAVTTTQITTPVTDDASTPITGNPSMTVVKSQTTGPTPVTAAGQVLGYEIVVANTGTVSLTGVTVDDTLPDGSTGAETLNSGDADGDGVLDVGETWTYQVNYTVTQADVDAGAALLNRAAVTTAEITTPVTDDASTPVSSDPLLTVEKTQTTGPNPVTAVGQVLGYEIVVANTGTVSLTGVAIVDTLPDGSTGPTTLSGGDADSDGVLDVGETWTYTASYTVTQTDIDQEADLVNRASVTTAQTPTPTLDDAVTSVEPTTGMTLVKTGVLSAGADGRADVGDTITYGFTVRNTGETTIQGVTLTDALVGVTVAGGPIASLAPGAEDTTTFTGTYVLTQADIDAAQVANTATAVGADGGGDPVQAQASAITPLPRAPALALDKTSTLNDGGDGRADVGDTVTYAFAVVNTGNVTLTGITVTDPMPGLTLSGGPIASLAPGATDNATITGLYTLTQADIDAGQVVNTATASGSTPSGEPAQGQDTETLALPAAPAMTLVKTGTLNDGGDGRADTGDSISYAFTVTNNGNVTLTAISITDPLPGLTLSGGPITSLAPGAADSTSITATYVLTQADVDAGQVLNTATAAGQGPGGTPVQSQGSATVPLPRAPAIELDKTSTLNDGGDGRADVGDTIAYAFRVTNAGNVTITNLTITDELAGLVMSGGPVASLAPGAEDATTFTGLYTLTQADVDAGQVINAATATGAVPGGTVTGVDAVTTPLPSAPAMTLVKTGTLNDGGDSRADAGDTVAYAFTVANTGNVTLTGITVADPLPGVTLSGGPIASLAPGATDNTTITGLYTLTQADIDAAQVVNAATATGADPAGGALSANDDFTLPLPGAPALTLVKTASVDPGADGRAGAGDTVSFAFAVTNAGNLTLNNITLTDALAGAVVTGGPIASLAPGATDSATFRATYTLTQADVDSGQLANTARATGVLPGGQPVTADGAVTTPIEAVASISATKTATLTTDGATPDVGNEGDVITYQVTITNTGTMTVSNMVVTDAFAGQAPVPLSCTSGPLAPGATMVCASYMHTITEAEARAAQPLENAVAVQGQALNNPAVIVTDDAMAVTPTAPGDTQLQVTKTAAPGDVNVGDLVRYTVVIRNVGEVDALDATVTDTPPSGFTLVEGSLTVDDADDVGRLAGTSPIRVDRIDIPVDEQATLTYLLRVGAGVRPGEHENRVQAQDGDLISNIASARVRLAGDPALEESLIVGTVFDDRDGDGWQDEGEPGIPGVRIASVEGLIMETDQFGRYHLIGVDGGPWERGRNVILKVDAATLPPGSRFTTDNPLLRRVTPGLPARFDFGVILPGQEVRP